MKIVLLRAIRIVKGEIVYGTRRSKKSQLTEEDEIKEKLRIFD